MALHLPHDERQWRRAAHGALLALGRRAADGGMLESDLVAVLHEELRIGRAIITDALDHLVRRELLRREQVRGLVADGSFYSLTPAGVTVLAGGPDELLSFRVAHE